MSWSFIFNETHNVMGRVVDTWKQGMRDNLAAVYFPSPYECEFMTSLMLVKLGRILKVKTLLLSLKISLEQMLRKQPVNENVL